MNNNCVKNDGKIKLGGYKGGRGYCGYHTTHFGKVVYLRSLQEYIYAIHLDRLGIYYLTENVIYNIDGKSYKPDFFIYDEKFSKLNKIVEIKYTNAEQSDYQVWFSDYFKKIGINYQVLCRYDIKQIIKSKSVSTEEISAWKNKFIENYSRFDYSGEKNPMYGIKHSEKTKKKIGSKTKKYFKNEEIVKKHKIGRELFWKSVAGECLKKQYSKLRKMESEIKNPTVICTCQFCGVLYKKKVKDRFHKQTCSNSCQQKYNWKIGKNVYCGGATKTYKSKIRKYFKTIVDDEINITVENYNDLVKKQKLCGNIPKNFGMNLNIVNKYFGSLINLKEEMN